MIYANDIPQALDCESALYADDTVLYSSSKRCDRVEAKLQLDMNNLERWCHLNKLTINTDKTKLMIFGNKSSRSKLKDLNVTSRAKR